MWRRITAPGAPAAAPSVATRPSGTGTPTRASSDLPWNSRRSTPLLRNVLFHPAHDVGERRARGEDLGQTLLFEDGDGVLRDGAAAEHHDVAGVALPQDFGHPWEQRHVGAGEQGEADSTHVLLE